MVRIKDVVYTYPSKTISFPDFEISQGNHHLILGQSGTGKTTLLHLLAGLLPLQSGSVVIDGQQLEHLKGSNLDKFRGQHIGVIFQTPHFIESLSIQENIAIAQSLAGHHVDYKSINNYLSRLGIADKANQDVSELSVGEKQRASIIRAVINNPSIILADEPSSALDDKNTAEVSKLLLEIAEEAGSTLLIVTHDHRLENYFSNKIILE